MNSHTQFENIIITKIKEILNNSQYFEKPFVNNDGDIIIRRKFKK